MAEDVKKCILLCEVSQVQETAVINVNTVEATERYYVSVENNTYRIREMAIKYWDANADNGFEKKYQMTFLETKRKTNK